MMENNQEETIWELVGELKEESNPETHPMVIAGNYLYVIDGKKLVRWAYPTETIWQKIWKFIKF